MQINNGRSSKIMNTTKSLVVVAVAAMAAMIAGTSIVGVNDAIAGKKGYEKNQATSQANACGKW